MSLKRTPFFSFHQEAGGRLIDFGGWELPVQYTGIIQEHKACRASVGLFDVSHMGEVWVRGPGALEAMRHLVTNDLDIVDGQAQYTAMCFPDGGIVDDLIVYRFAEDELLICVNASNREKDFAWMVDNNPCPDRASFEDEGEAWAQVAVQGRHAEATLQALTPVDLSGIGFYRMARGTVAGVDGCILARTGYTGEDGFEVFLPPSGAAAMWGGIMEAGAPHGLVPVGLGARDTLRLEARMCLYGNDIDATTTPLEAGLAWVVKLSKEDFIGKAALAAQKEGGLTRRLVAMEVEKRIARPHSPILVDGEVVGEVTSGTRSPSLETNIALGYVPRRCARPGSVVQVDIRGKQANATVVKPPFYKRDY
jgi:aminomethyltransferase